MMLAVSLNFRYRVRVRMLVTLFAAMAIFLSGLHAGPAGAHDGDPVQASAHAADHQHGDGGEDPISDEQHDDHHHCPSAAAPDHGIFVAGDFFINMRLLPPNMIRLGSTTLAPPLAPPKA